MLATLRGGLGPNFVGLANVNGFPALVFSYANAGVVDTQGIDVAFNYYVSDRVLADFNYSWFDFTVKSKNAFIISSHVCGPHETSLVGSGLNLFFAELSKWATQLRRAPLGAATGSLKK